MPKNQIPEKYRCAITGMVMIDPVFTADGHTYEREAIEKWLQTHETSPKTNEKLEHKKLTDNHDKRGDILEFLESNPELYDGKEVYLPQVWKIQCVIAIKGNRLEEFQKLLNKDRRLLTTDLENDSTSFHLACEFSSPEFVEGLLKILTQRDEGISMMPETGRFNPIHLNVLLERTLVKGEYSKCELLLKLGAEIEQVETITQNTLLHRMVMKGNQEASNWLLDQKAELESRDNEGNTSLLLSIIHVKTKITELLLQKNADLEVKNVQQKSAFYIAVEKSDIGAARLLLENGADPMINCGKAQLTTLHVAAARIC